MSIEQLASRLAAEAERRGVTPEALVDELAARLDDPLEAFIGCAASGRAGRDAGIGPDVDHVNDPDDSSADSAPPAARRAWFASCDNAAMSVTPVIEIDGSQVDLARVAVVCARYGLAELALFGSTARGEAGRNSDVDLLYVLAPDARLGFAIDDLEDDLAQLFGRKVDLVSKKALHRLLRDEVVAQARTLYAA